MCVCVYGRYIDYYRTHSPLAEAKGEGKGHGNQGISCMRQETKEEGRAFSPSVLSPTQYVAGASNCTHWGKERRTFFGPSALFPQRGEGPILNRLILSGWALEIAEILRMPARAGKLFWSPPRRVNPAPDCFPYVGRRDELRRPSPDRSTPAHARTTHER